MHQAGVPRPDRPAPGDSSSSRIAWRVAPTDVRQRTLGRRIAVGQGGRDVIPRAQQGGAKGRPGPRRRGRVAMAQRVVPGDPCRAQVRIDGRCQRLSLACRRGTLRTQPDQVRLPDADATRRDGRPGSDRPPVRPSSAVASAPRSPPRPGRCRRTACSQCGRSDAVTASDRRVLGIQSVVPHRRIIDYRCRFDAISISGVASSASHRPVVPSTVSGHPTPENSTS